MQNIDSQWYAVKTRSRHEQRVTDRLKAKSFDIFFPQVEVWSRRKDRKKKIMSPLFSSYLFVCCKLNKDIWIEILKTFGVVNLLGYTDQPTPIPSDQITSIQTVTNSGIQINSHPFLTIGDKVIVKEGPLKGAIGVYNSYNHKKGTLIVSVDLLNRSVEVEIESVFVESF